MSANQMAVWQQTVGAFLIGLVIMAALPLVADYYTLTLLVVYGILALSLGLIWGYGGILCFGQAAFFGIGGYTFAIAAINFDAAWPALFLAVAVPALFAAVLGAMMFYGRLGDVYLAVVTLVVTLILFKFMNATAGQEWVIGAARLGGFNGIPGFPTLHLPWDAQAWLIDDRLYYFCFVLLLLCLSGCRLLLASSFGRIIIGIRENETRLQLLGYDTHGFKTALFTVGGGLAGLAGALFANWSEIVTPGLFSLGQSAEIIIWVLIGGVGTLIGPVIGAALLGWLKFVFGQQSVIDNSLVMGVLLILVVLRLPSGLLPAFAALAARLLPGRGGGRRRRLLAARNHRPGETPTGHEGGSAHGS
ncbi:MAG: branched-chain amino acid ABC transporter permease [Gammaproteobacteria bacterium]|nr:branched-chain amino acid ABC transporter permease [Gammaproteobacteria bacterium]